MERWNNRKRLHRYLGPHHGVSFPGCALPVRHQAGIIAGENVVQNRLAKCLVNACLVREILRHWIRRVEAIIETIFSNPLSTVSGLARRYFQVR